MFPALSLTWLEKSKLCLWPMAIWERLSFISGHYQILEAVDDQIVSINFMLKCKICSDIHNLDSYHASRTFYNLNLCWRSIWSQLCWNNAKRWRTTALDHSLPYNLTMFTATVSLHILFVFLQLYLMAGYYYTATEEYDIKWTMPHCVLTLKLIGE